MQIDIDDNPNCTGSPQFVFKELGGPEPVRGLLVGDEGKESECDVVGVEEGGRWVQAVAIKIADSSDGVAWMIRGGAWGIRLRPEKARGRAWSLEDRGQWGEPYKIYGKREDILDGTSPS